MDKTNVSNESGKTSRMPLQGTRMIISALLCFLGCLLYMPSADVLRTLPFIAVFAAAADVVYKELRYNTALVFVFSFSLLCFNGFELNYSAIYSVCGAVFAVAAIYGVRLLRASFKTNREELKKRCRIRAVAVLVLCFALYMLLCGNLISVLMAKSENLGYIEKNYKDSVTVKYTDYDALSREYKTYISFRYDGNLVGEADACYISKNHDGRREYLEDVLTSEMSKYLKLYLSEAVDMFEITNSGLYFESDEVLPENADASHYEKKAWYVVSLYHTVDNKRDFAKLCSRCVSVLKENPEFKFSEIIICGGEADKVLYTFTLNKATLEKDGVTAAQVNDFDSGYMKKYGVTEKTYLDYWQNR